MCQPIGLALGQRFVSNLTAGQSTSSIRIFDSILSGGSYDIYDIYIFPHIFNKNVKINKKNIYKYFSGMGCR